MHLLILFVSRELVRKCTNLHCSLMHGLKLTQSVWISFCYFPGKEITIPFYATVCIECRTASADLTYNQSVDHLILWQSVHINIKYISASTAAKFPDRPTNMRNSSDFRLKHVMTVIMLPNMNYLSYYFYRPTQLWHFHPSGFKCLRERKGIYI